MLGTLAEHLGPIDPETSMNSKHLMAVVALLVGFAVFLILSKPMWWKEPAAGDPDAIVRLQERMLALERSQAERQKVFDDTIEGLRRSIDRSRLSATPEGVALTAREAAGEGAPNRPRARRARARTASRPAEALTLETALAGLLDKKLDWDESEKLWKRIRAAGLTDEVIKELEKRAAANPKDADAQTILGNAYLKKCEEVPQGPESGLWATRADQAYDRALELNPEHWESRFMKAVALSFWPAAFGKGPRPSSTSRRSSPSRSGRTRSRGLPRPTTSSGTCISRPASAIRRSPPGSEACDSSPTARSFSSSSGARGSSGAPGQARTAGFSRPPLGRDGGKERAETQRAPRQQRGHGEKERENRSFGRVSRGFTPVTDHGPWMQAGACAPAWHLIPG